jgi:hypothetical protein
LGLRGGTRRLTRAGGADVEKELPHTRSGCDAMARFTLSYDKTYGRASRTPLRHGARVCVSNPVTARRSGLLLEPFFGEVGGSASRTQWRTTDVGSIMSTASDDARSTSLFARTEGWRMTTPSHAGCTRVRSPFSTTGNGKAAELAVAPEPTHRSQSVSFEAVVRAR